MTRIFKLEELISEEEYLKLDNNASLLTVEDWMLAFIRLGWRRIEKENDNHILTWDEEEHTDIRLTKG